MELKVEVFVGRFIFCSRELMDRAEFDPHLRPTETFTNEQPNCDSEGQAKKKFDRKSHR